MAEPVPLCDLPHGRQHRGRQPATAAAGLDLGRQGAESADRRARPVLRDDLLDGRVDAFRQCFVLAGPRERAGEALRQHRVSIIVVKDELELREFLIEPAPPLVYDIAVMVVLGPDRRRVAGDLPIGLAALPPCGS